ncbi:hypothetical protein B0J18DRAFT_379787 [Chaetomium sp. MPI-SDFR-AT-0129]|nr:hypothetical protein B0J18DRAFT_379787 [Chaetomium sp. MPI-SDFR-AT-0129]
MVASTFLTTALAAVSLLFSADGALARQSGFTPPSRTYHGSREVCPERCYVSGPNPGNWSAYPSLKLLRTCQKTMFYDFSLYDPLDDPTVNHRIHACSSFGSDFSTIPPDSADAQRANTSTSATPVPVQFEVGWWSEGFGLAAPGLRSLITQLREYVGRGYGATDRPFIMFGQSGPATIGLYIGHGLLNQAIGESALRIFQYNLDNLNVSTPSLAMQLCAPGYDSAHVFGVMVTSNATFGPIQDAIKTWANATCLSFVGSRSFAGDAVFTAPLLPTNGTVGSNSSTIQSRALHPRADCRTVQVQGGDSCGSLAIKCGISGATFTKYNPGSSFCSSLRPGQHVCCSSGSLPDFRPVPNADGSCSTYKVKTDDNCADIAAAYSLTVDDIESFNKKTWGWSGCKLLFPNTFMCLSKGTPPFPASISNAQCGPQKPGSQPPTDGSDIASLNPCPLNACCNIWGQCGLSRDFCIDTNTGPPGTAAPGTYGCISNCGLDVIKGDGNGAIKVAYFEGYGFNRDCLFQDASQLDTGKFTHVHFAFATLSPTYEVQLGDALASYQFSEFKRISGAKKIVSIGGWDFSTSPSTIDIFRTGVTAANRLAMAKSIAKFVIDNDLDGVDIDWEYPGAPDIPAPRTDGQDEGPNYLAFLVVLRNCLPNKSISIAAPASYWYLKQFPLLTMSKVVDYIVYMTYDLHGQWDAHNQWSQDGCEAGNCLRSHVNLTETRQALAMITKAGVPGRKIVVGVTSYGRSFQMADPGCWGPNCKFTGDRLNSDATKGRCTGTAGYIADAETDEIMADGGSRVVTSFIDATSNSNILVYDNNQWVSYMSFGIKKIRTSLYASWGMGGTTDWASDLQEFHPVPGPLKDWDAYKLAISVGEDPKIDNTRTGNWTSLNCSEDMVMYWGDYLAADRWTGLYAADAWKDIVRVWFDTDQARKKTFTGSVSETLGTGLVADCANIANGKVDNCDATLQCPEAANGKTSGPAAVVIWDSLVLIHEKYHEFYDAINDAHTSFNSAIDDMEETFAPVPEVKDKDAWLDMLIDAVSFGAVAGLGRYIKIAVKDLAYFAENESKTEQLVEVVGALVDQGKGAVKKEAKEPPGDWTEAKQKQLGTYLGLAFDGWADAARNASYKLFDGSQESVRTLGDLISGGKFTGGKGGGKDDNSNKNTGLKETIGKAFFGFAIPAIWRASNNYAFVIDSGYACNVDRPLPAFLEDNTMNATGACVDGMRYYLVAPTGNPLACSCPSDNTDGHECPIACDHNKFSAPPGLDQLGGRFGGVTVEDLTTAAVRAWIAKGKDNDVDARDAMAQAALDDVMASDDAQVPFTNLPVCSADRALQGWTHTTAGSSDSYPCGTLPGINACGDSTFVDQTSDASPLVSDCLQIIKNIEGDPTTSYSPPTINGQSGIAWGPKGCTFGVEVTEPTAVTNMYIGGQDIIDIINDAVKKFGGSGKVGAKGNMVCNGLPILWGLY